ncbi:hypothetical protein OG548_39340 [Streptomyces sp. NBC_01356]|nr:hypothetical protein [Streptomyces sp. NBC_01356]
MRGPGPGDAARAGGGEVLAPAALRLGPVDGIGASPDVAAS